MSDRQMKIGITLLFLGLVVILIIAGQGDGPVAPVDVPTSVEVNR